MPRESPHCAFEKRGPGRRSAGAARFANATLSKLHDMPRESSRVIRGSDILPMRLLTLFLAVSSLLAQDAAKPAEQAAKPADSAAKTADQPAPAAPAEPPAASSGEGWLSGSLEVGYRWIPNITGNFDAYRSVVNMGEGPKLLDADFTLRDPSRRVFDRADVHATSWGGDPYNTLRVDVQNNAWYRLTADYRNIAYFNFLPSYADPTLSRGLLLDQNSFDTHIRTTNVQLDLLPKKWITPYLGFGRNTQFGR